MSRSKFNYSDGHLILDDQYEDENERKLTSNQTQQGTSSSIATDIYLNRLRKERFCNSIQIPKNSKLKIATIALVAIILIETSVILVRVHYKGFIQIPDKPRSCLDLKARGETGSGVKKIYDVDDHTYEVYCDLDTDGGGWTLVASVHEDDIKMKCNSKDKWSAFASSGALYRGKTAWESCLVFGSPDRCTSADYKIRAYYSMEAKNVMIWHVPNDTPLESIRNNSQLRYRTTNDFLSQYGNNLQKLFQDYYDLSIKENYPTIANFKSTIASKRVLDAIASTSQKLISFITSWHDYTSWGTIQKSDIIDGWMYEDTGNEVTFETSTMNATLIYNQERWWGIQSFSTITRTSPLFIMASAVRNEAQESEFFATTVHSQFYSISESKIPINNEMTSGNFHLMYRSLYYPDHDYDSTACEFHFIIYNQKDWSSRKPVDFRLDVELMHQNERIIGFKTDGSPSNFVMGYILLATNDKSPSKVFTQKALDNVAQTILESLTDYFELFTGFPGSNGLAVPVKFDKGNKTTVRSMIPERLKPFAEPGYLQIRAYNEDGFPNALCPGVRMNTSYAKYVCVGGLSNEAGVKGTCGDYAGWDGKSDTYGAKGRSEYAHSQNDVDSTILIFYR